MQDCATHSHDVFERCVSSLYCRLRHASCNFPNCPDRPMHLQVAAAAVQGVAAARTGRKPPPTATPSPNLELSASAPASVPPTADLTDNSSSSSPGTSQPAKGAATLISAAQPHLLPAAQGAGAGGSREGGPVAVKGAGVGAAAQGLTPVQAKPLPAPLRPAHQPSMLMSALTLGLWPAARQGGPAGVIAAGQASKQAVARGSAPGQTGSQAAGDQSDAVPGPVAVCTQVMQWSESRGIEDREGLQGDEQGGCLVFSSCESRGAARAAGQAGCSRISTRASRRSGRGWVCIKEGAQERVCRRGENRGYQFGWVL